LLSLAETPEAVHDVFEGSLERFLLDPLILKGLLQRGVLVGEGLVESPQLLQGVIGVALEVGDLGFEGCDLLLESL
jgi:hypothetical protein